MNTIESTLSSNHDTTPITPAYLNIIMKPEIENLKALDIWQIHNRIPKGIRHA